MGKPTDLFLYFFSFLVNLSHCADNNVSRYHKANKLTPFIRLVRDKLKYRHLLALEEHNLRYTQLGKRRKKCTFISSQC